MKIDLNKIWPWTWLIAGTVLMYYSNWTWAFSACTWLFSIFLLRFTRTQKKRIGLPVLCTASIVVGVASMYKLLSIEAIPPLFRILSGLAVGVIFFLPFLADRLIVSKLPPFIATLIFPCTWTALEYIKSLGGGSWGALAYTQYGNLPLMQLVSVTGIWGISFLITWFASLTNFAWEQQFVWGKFKKIAIFYGLILFLVFLYGYGRPLIATKPADSVCLASVTNPREFVERFYKPDWTDRASAYQYMKTDLHYLFNETINCAKGGAKIVLWQEYAVSVMEEKEPEFIQHAIKIAQNEQIYLALAIGLFPLDYPRKPWQNKLIWINPDGKVVAQYLKQKPAQPLEPIVPGTGGIAVLDTVYGRIACIICADLDYPSLVRQAGTRNADLLLIPAQDWAAVDPLHTHMAVFRAIENGTAMIKGTGGGLSIVVDPYGRVINTLDYFGSTQTKMISCLSLKGVTTVYSQVSDAFAWGCLGGTIIMSGWGYVTWRRKQ